MDTHPYGTERNGPQGAVSHREDWAIRRNGPHGGVIHKEERAT